MSLRLPQPKIITDNTIDGVNVSTGLGAIIDSSPSTS
jgi:hypothetical protein